MLVCAVSVRARIGARVSRRRCGDHGMTLLLALKRVAGVWSPLVCIWRWRASISDIVKILLPHIAHDVRGTHTVQRVQRSNPSYRAGCFDTHSTRTHIKCHTAALIRAADLFHPFQISTRPQRCITVMAPCRLRPLRVDANTEKKAHAHHTERTSVLSES